MPDELQVVAQAGNGLLRQQSAATNHDQLKFVGPMRLDLFLKASRLSTGRSIAQKLCDAGLVSINDNPAKSAHAVKPGDVLTIHTRSRWLVVRIAAVPATHNTPRKEAATLYEIIKDERLADSE